MSSDSSEDLQTLVNRAMDNALENGYAEVQKDPLEVAQDMVMFDADLETYDPEQLTDAIRVWQLKKMGEWLS